MLAPAHMGLLLESTSANTLFAVTAGLVMWRENSGAGDHQSFLRHSALTSQAAVIKEHCMDQW